MNSKHLSVPMRKKGVSMETATLQVTYREARPCDADGIALLHAESWRHTYRGVLRDGFLDDDLIQNRRTHWRERLASPTKKQFVLLAERGELILGFISVVGEADEQWGTLIDNLHTRPNMKGHGIGTELMRKAGTWVQTHFPQSGLHLWVFEANYSARKFYERLGAVNHYRVVGDVPGGGTAPALRYVWTGPDRLVELINTEHPHENTRRRVR